MRLNELTKAQLNELKVNLAESKGLNLLWSDIADIDSVISDGELKEEYENTNFTEDDFFSSNTKEITLEVPEYAIDWLSGDHSYNSEIENNLNDIQKFKSDNKLDLLLSISQSFHFSWNPPFGKPCTCYDCTFSLEDIDNCDSLDEFLYNNCKGTLHEIFNS